MPQMKVFTERFAVHLYFLPSFFRENFLHYIFPGTRRLRDVASLKQNLNFLFIWNFSILHTSILLTQEILFQWLL